VTASADQERTPQESIADYVEEWLTAAGLTLTDEKTALTFTRTLELVSHTMDGAVAQGVIKEAQRVRLIELLMALRHAPGLV
jgi:hypothetical protein